MLLADREMSIGQSRHGGTRPSGRVLSRPQRRRRGGFAVPHSPGTAKDSSPSVSPCLARSPPEAGKRVVNLIAEPELLEKPVPLSPSPFPSELTLPVNVFLASTGAALIWEARGIEEEGPRCLPDFRVRDLGRLPRRLSRRAHLLGGRAGNEERG